MRRRLLVAMSTVEKCPCLKTLPANTSIGFSLSIRFYFILFSFNICWIFEIGENCMNSFEDC